MFNPFPSSMFSPFPSSMFSPFPSSMFNPFPPASLTPSPPAPRPREQALASPDNIYPFAWALDGRRIGESSNSSFRSDSPSHFLVRRSGIPRSMIYARKRLKMLPFHTPTVVKVLRIVGLSLFPLMCLQQMENR